MSSFGSQTCPWYLKLNWTNLALIRSTWSPSWKLRNMWCNSHIMVWRLDMDQQVDILISWGIWLEYAMIVLKASDPVIPRNRIILPSPHKSFKCIRQSVCTLSLIEQERPSYFHFESLQTASFRGWSDKFSNGHIWLVEFHSEVRPHP